MKLSSQGERSGLVGSWGLDARLNKHPGVRRSLLLWSIGKRTAG